MTSREFAIVFMIAAFMIIVIVDIVLALNRRGGDTFSEILRGVDVPFIILIAFGMGLLAGHWWW